MTNKTLIFAALAALTPTLTLASGMHAGGHDDPDATAYGAPGTAAQVSRSIEVQAADNMRYTPATIAVRRGETIKFVVRNTGKMPHELVLGDVRSLKEHAEVMRRSPDMEHDDPNMVKVAPGGTGTLIWTFTKTGKVDFACLIPGHYEAGMKGSIRVDAK